MVFRADSWSTCPVLQVRKSSYNCVCGRDSSLSAVISLQLGPSLDTLRLLQKKTTVMMSSWYLQQLCFNHIAAKHKSSKVYFFPQNLKALDQQNISRITSKRTVCLQPNSRWLPWLNDLRIYKTSYKLSIFTLSILSCGSSWGWFSPHTLSSNRSWKIIKVDSQEFHLKWK